MLNINKYELINKLKKKKIIVNCHYIPLSKFKILKKFISNKKFDNSEKYYKEAISIPMYPKLNHAEQTYVIKTLKNIIKRNRKK